MSIWDSINYSPPGSVHGILQARISEWVAIPFSRGSSGPRDQTQVSHIVGRFSTDWATREALTKPHTLSEFPLSLCYCSVPQACPTLKPHGLQHARLPCLSLSPGVCSSSCPLSRWCRSTISSPIIPFSSCPQSFLHQGPFQFPYLSPLLFEDPIQDTTIHLVSYSFNVHN